MRTIDALSLSLSLALALASCTPPAATPSSTPSPSASAAPPPSAAPAIASASPAASAPPKDWMWEVLGGTRVVYLRARNPEGTWACERYRLEPTGLPASYQGSLVLDDDDAQEPRVEATYEGNPPQLSAPRVQLGKGTLPLDCEEGSLAWYTSEEDCTASGEPRIHSAGCASLTSRTARERARRMLSGETRTALLSRLARATRIWRGPSCEETFVREGKAPSFAGSDNPTPSFRRAGKPAFLYLETASDDYPSIVRSGPSGSLSLDETTDRNPHRVRAPGLGDIAIGCCDSVSYDVLDVSADRAHVRARRAAHDKSARPAEVSAWFFVKSTCELERGQTK